MILNNIKPSLKMLISSMASLTNLEYAVFDNNSQLVSSTEVYLHRKGNKVHSASIEEVINQGNIIVNKPGYMRSCVGCRFAANCPSTIEILSCIKINSTPIGVVSLTSFSQEGHNMIEENICSYMEMLEYITNLISMFAYNESTRNNVEMLNIAMGQISSTINHKSIVMNRSGLLLYWDKSIQNYFSYCDLYSQTIYQIFSDEIIKWIFSIKKSSKKYYSFGDFTGTIYVTPLYIGNEVEGYYLRLDEEKKETVSYKSNYLDNIISNNDKIVSIKEVVLKIANSSSSVLITGETGTGKEMFAKAIHYSSNRRNKPFVPINCANIPEALFESELFGYEEGAFTGAKKGGKQGLFEISSGGTIFLDEIGELPLYLQAKLLRVLQEKSIQRLGSLNPIPIDIRVISATNQNLEEMIAENKFREDLFYRINVIPFYLPPLSQRKEDIEILALYFINKYNLILNKSIISISPNSMDLLRQYPWPGNVRELENVIEYAINMEDSDIIQSTNLPYKLIRSARKPIPSNLKNQISAKEYTLIISALDKNGWDVNGKEKTAQEMGISLRTLYRKLRDCNYD